MGCRLFKLPDSLAGLTGLARLECSENATLLALPAALGASQHALAAVLAERCALRTFPVGLTRAHGLRALSLAGNALETLPASAFAGSPPSSLTAPTWMVRHPPRPRIQLLLRAVQR